METLSDLRAGSGQLSVDENGAPVTFEASRWLVCFVPGLKPQFWHRLVHQTHKHVLLLKPNTDGTWTLFEPWWTRLLVRTISTDQAVRFLTWATMGDVLLVEEDIPGRGSQIRGWTNCVSLAAFVLGRPYCVWSPHALYERLRSEARTQAIDAADFIDRYRVARRARHAQTFRDNLAPRPSPDLHRGLIDLAGEALRLWTMPRRVGAPPAPASPEITAPSTAGRYGEQRQQELLAALALRLAGARDRGEVAVDDCQAAAGELLGMLRSDPFTQIVLHLGVPPTEREIENRAASITATFLDAVRAGPPRR